MPCLVHMSCPFNISSHWPDSQSLITCSQVVSVTRGRQRRGGESSQSQHQHWWPCWNAADTSLLIADPFVWFQLFVSQWSVEERLHDHETKGWIRAGLFLNLLFSFLPRPAGSRFSISLVSLSVCILLFFFRKGGAVRDHKNCVGFKPQKFEMLQIALMKS